MPDSNSKKKRILLAGVPFGRDNVGDEAIIECVVHIVRELAPDADIWVSTDDQEATGKKLEVNTHPLFGFDPPGFSSEEMKQAIADCDVFIWSGATGLSDYPDIPLEMMEHAVALKKKTVVFCTGMNDRLNPSLYTLLPGMRRKAFDTLKSVTLGAIDLSQQFETTRINRTHETMRRVLPQVTKLINRDEESQRELSAVLGSETPIQVGADPAITLNCADLSTCTFTDAAKAFLNRTEPKIGLCISAQSPVKDLAAMQKLFDRLMVARGLLLVGIPMNPITDAALLEDFRQGLTQADRMHVLQGRFEPDEITTAASKMDVVISSRLHLLILASITLTPFIGISRGTKVTNFTRQFDLPDTGSVESMDWEQFGDEIERLLDGRSEFRAKAKTVRLEMMARLNEAKKALQAVLND